MSKHEYKFGDRAHGPRRCYRVVVVQARGDKIFVVFDDRTHGWFQAHLFTPGWPVPEGCVRVRAAVVATTDEDWGVAGTRDMSDRDAEREAMDLINAGRKFGDIHFIEADIPLQTPKTYRAEVVS